MIRGTFILAASGAICRVIGFIVRILLVRIVGPEGIGLFTRVSAIYSLILSLASAGVPVALARLSAIGLERGDTRYLARLFGVALIITIATGVAATALFLGAAPLISSRILGDPRTYPVAVCLSPALLIVAVSSVARGLLQGNQWMEPIAIGQFSERLVSAGVTLALAGPLLLRGVQYSAAGIAIGTVAGELAGFLVVLTALLWMLRGGFGVRGLGTGGFMAGRSRAGGFGAEGVETAVEIASIALPVTFLRVSASAVSAISAVIIPAGLLEGGVTLTEATSLYGNFSGIAMSLVFFPTILTFALSSNLVPALSRALEGGDEETARRNTERAIMLTLILGLGSTGILVALGGPVCEYLFRAPEAGPVTVALALGSVFIYLRATSGGIMHGLGMVTKSLLNFVAANAVGVALTYFLVSQPSVGIHGAAAGIILSSAMDAALNLRDVRKKLGLRWGRARSGSAGGGSAKSALIRGVSTRNDSILSDPVRGLRVPLLVGLAAGLGARTAYLTSVRAGLPPLVGLSLGLLAGGIGIGAGFILAGVVRGPHGNG